MPTDCTGERVEILEDIFTVLKKYPEISKDTIKTTLTHINVLTTPKRIFEKNFYKNAEHEVLSTPRYKQTCTQITVNFEKSDEPTNAPLCPILKRPIVNPFVGPCGHTIEMSAAEDLFKKGTNVKCPHLGCHKFINPKKTR